MALVAAYLTSIASAIPPCTMQVVFTGASPAANRLAVLATSTPVTEIAPGGFAAAPGRADANPLEREVHASRFQVADIPSFVPRQGAEILRRSLGAIWVVPWFRNPGCALESSWLGRPLNRGFRAVLFLTQRPESLWVNGEPTFDTFDGSFSPNAIWETDPTNSTPISLHDLNVYLAVYPRLVGIKRWDEPRDIDWAMKHRDSANTAALRDRFQHVTSEQARSAARKTRAPLAGFWRGEGTSVSGDSLHFRMWLPAAPVELEWATAQGVLPWYSGPAPFDSLPPGQYRLRAEFSPVRDTIAPDSSAFSVSMQFPVVPNVASHTYTSWGWLARFGPRVTRAGFAHADSLSRRLVKLTPSEQWPEQAAQEITMNAAGDSLVAQVHTRLFNNGWVQVPIATWTAHRVP